MLTKLQNKAIISKQAAIYAGKTFGMQVRNITGDQIWDQIWGLAWGQVYCSSKDVIGVQIRDHINFLVREVIREQVWD